MATQTGVSRRREIGGIVQLVLESLTSTLMDYARRQVDASTAAARVCDAVVRVGTPVARCGVVCDERLLVGRVGEDEALAFRRAVARSDQRRGLLTRESDTDGIFAALDLGYDWIAIEPLRARSGAYLGALVVVDARASRDDVLRALPTAALVACDVAFELCCAALFEQRLHTFNNSLAVLATNVEYLAQAASLGDALPAPERERLGIAARHAADGVGDLLKEAAAMREALPLGRPRRPA